jgi:hypothetical protein
VSALHIDANHHYPSTAACHWLLLCMQCRLPLRINCVAGSSYDVVVASISKGDVKTWAARDCYPYVDDASESCFLVNGPAATCKSKLPAGRCPKVLKGMDLVFQQSMFYVCTLNEPT